MTSLEYIPNAVKRLKLVSAFKGYNPGVLDCIEISRNDQIMVVDDEECTHISTATEDAARCCLCINPNRKEIVVLSLDKKLIKQRQGGMADGAAFDENKFAFLEFKDQAQGHTSEAIEGTYTKATSQLSAALNLFSDKLKDEKVAIDFINTVNVICHIIVSEKFPRASALEQNMMLTFALSNNGVGLSFEREVRF